MSRRDTIIVAVLVNAALLMILFATAVRSDRPKKESGRIQLAEATVVDEDDLLNQYVTSVPTLIETARDEVLLAEEPVVSLLAPPREKPKPEVASAKPESHFVNVTVKNGDFLEKIAKANNTSVKAIMDANHLANTQLKIGQVLKVPVSEGQKKITPVQENVEYYVVKDGDNPWLIASRNHVKLEELLRLNGLDEQKARRLRPGDKLRIR